MSESKTPGWHALLDGFPWFTAAGDYPLPAYSEFTPPPRLGRTAYGEPDPAAFTPNDPYGWYVSELEQEYELTPGLDSLAQQILAAMHRLGEGQPEHIIAGHEDKNLRDNPYWPPELSERAGKLLHERYVLLLPLALSRTQDDMGRVRWTFFGASEQGPERAFWQSFYSAPDQEQPERDSLTFIASLLNKVYGETADSITELKHGGFHILPTEPDPQFPYWTGPLPAWTRPFVIDDHTPLNNVRYLLTFRPFSRLPADARARYLAGQLHLLPFPGSLVAYGMPTYRHLQPQLPMAMQVPLLRLTDRQGGPTGIRVPQSGWIREPAPDLTPSQVRLELVRDSYRRTHRWNRVHRYNDELADNPIVDKVARVLFSTESDALGLYNKPMGRNVQIWTRNFDLVLDGPNATPAQLAQAHDIVNGGGLYGYRFIFPAMRVGVHELYWHRPLVAYWSVRAQKAEVLAGAPLGYLTAYRHEAPDLAEPLLLWPRLRRRPLYLAALLHDDPVHDHYARQTPLNIITLLDHRELLAADKLPPSFARHLLRLAKDDSLDEWLAGLSLRAGKHAHAHTVPDGLRQLIARAEEALPEPLTFGETATRAFEEAYWNNIVHLAHGRYVNKDNADMAQPRQTESTTQHERRDLEQLGDYLLERYHKAIGEAGMEGKAVCGDMPFQWRTDFNFPLYGGWQSNQEGHPRERNIVVIIPGRDHSRAVIMADHYDTAYMEDLYEKDRGGKGIRKAAAGADDDHSGTATLLLAAPIFLRLAKEGKLEHDIWLVHLTGEEFPADCLGARFLCQSLVEGTLQLRTGEGEKRDVSSVRVEGVYVMDMIAHNRDNAQDIFQISPGRGAASLRLAWHAHIANMLWNAKAGEWNKQPERKGLPQGKRSADGLSMPAMARFLPLHGEVRTVDDPQSSLYNTDGQIFSDTGVPVVLFMENYDINRVGYHDTHDTLELIDLDYGAAFAAICIESVARVAAERRETPSGPGSTAADGRRRQVDE
jgi:hypothetical protein